MILMRILPGILKELSKNVPAVLFQTVEWNELAHELPTISRRLIQKEGYEELFSNHQALLKPYNIILTDGAVSHSGPLEDKWVGEKLLTLYFTQLFTPQGLFLDLRLNHFKNQNPIFQWIPSHLWTKFNEEFRQGLLNVYEGFYLEDDQLYYQGLDKIGLLKPGLSEEDRKTLGDLFKAQFGNALNEEMQFDLEHLKDAIIKMSNWMLNKKVQISKDFLYLGIYLVTLYSSLEQTNARLPVKKIYLEVRGRFTAKELS